MSQVDVDNIIKKYEKSITRPKIDKPDHQQTERKKQQKQNHSITFMDNSFTPNRQYRPNSSQTRQVQELLRQLDQSERRYIIVDKNYADVSRKYQKIKHAHDILVLQLQRQRKGRLQQLVDTQNRLHLIQIDNQKYDTKLQTKQQTIAILKQKLAQKQQQVRIFQNQLQHVSKKLCLSLQKNQQLVGLTHQNYGRQKKQITFQLMQERYQKLLLNSRAEYDKYTINMSEKQKQKKQLLSQMEQMSKKHLVELKDIKEVLAKNQSQYRQWIDENKKQKIALIQKYEKQINDIRKNQMFNKLEKSDNAIQSSNYCKSMISELQKINYDLQNQIKTQKLEKQDAVKNYKQSIQKLYSLQEQLSCLKQEYQQMLNQNRQTLKNIREQEQENQKLKNKSNSDELQMQDLMIKYNQKLCENKSLQKQINKYKNQMQKQLKSLTKVKKQLDNAANNELNMNSVLTQMSVKLQQKIVKLQEELNLITTELYAQRLEKAKLGQQLQQTRVQLKKQYDLSLQNTRRQLIEQIKHNTQHKDIINSNKQQQEMYLKMFQIERNYELLKSQVVTSQEILKMGSKICKFYQRKNK